MVFEEALQEQSLGSVHEHGVDIDCTQKMLSSPFTTLYMPKIRRYASPSSAVQQRKTCRDASATRTLDLLSAINVWASMAAN